MLTHPRNALDVSELLSPRETRLPADEELKARSPVGGATKRLIDLLLSAVAIVLLLPTFAIVAAVIKLTSKGPVFFSHPRIGFGGKPFRCYKFRTMVCDSEAVLASLLASSPSAALEWSQSQKLKNDPRVTGIGRLLRKSSLDELPQLFNVVLGQMSLVGPRPVTQTELKRFGRSASKYLAARPGLTGLWQVSGRSSLNYSRRVALDRYYVSNWSPLLDLKIVLRTIPALLKTSHTS
jgi:exopolysaccharide production protein ExoY